MIRTNGGFCRSYTTPRARICQASWARAIIMGLLGGIAQLGERLHGMQEVSGSIPLTSTSITKKVVKTVPVSSPGRNCSISVPFV